MLTIEHAENLFELRDYQHCLKILDKLKNDEGSEIITYSSQNLGYHEEDCCKALEMKTYCLQNLGLYEEALRSVNEALKERNSLRMKMVKLDILSRMEMDTEANEVLLSHHHNQWFQLSIRKQMVVR